MVRSADPSNSRDLKPPSTMLSCSTRTHGSMPRCPSTGITCSNPLSACIRAPAVSVFRLTRREPTSSTRRPFPLSDVCSPSSTSSVTRQPQMTRHESLKVSLCTRMSCFVWLTGRLRVHIAQAVCRDVRETRPGHLAGRPRSQERLVWMLRVTLHAC